MLDPHLIPILSQESSSNSETERFNYETFKYDSGNLISITTFYRLTLDNIDIQPVCLSGCQIEDGDAYSHVENVMISTESLWVHLYIKRM